MSFSRSSIKIVTCVEDCYILCQILASEHINLLFKLADRVRAALEALREAQAKLFGSLVRALSGQPVIHKVTMLSILLTCEQCDCASFLFKYFCEVAMGTIEPKRSEKFQRSQNTSLPTPCTRVIRSRLELHNL